MKLEPKAWMLAGLLATAGLTGCGSGLDGVDKRLNAMQDEIVKVQSQNDRLVERIDAMEQRQAKVESAQSEKGKVATAQPNSERPSLKVVKVVPEDTSGMPSPQVGTVPPGEAADDASPRPVIKLRGGGKGDAKSEARGDKSEARGDG